MNPAADPPRNLSGGAWLFADMALNIWALTIVKMLGLGYPAFQLVFLRALVGLVLMLPWAWQKRDMFRAVPDLGLHGARVALSAVALSASFYAIARLPFALFTAISFTRPLLMMALAALFLREVISSGRWIAAVIGLIGVTIAVNPGDLVAGWGLPAMFLTVFAGTSAIILTRRLVQAPAVVMMTFYTVGLTAFTAPLAWLTWQPVAPTHWPALLAIGLFAQCAQFCFLRAHALGQAGFLAVLGYSSLVLSTSVGVLVFDEVPSLQFWAGTALIIAATLWVTINRKSKR